MNEKELDQAELERGMVAAAEDVTSLGYSCMEVAGIESMVDCDPPAVGHLSN